MVVDDVIELLEQADALLRGHELSEDEAQEIAIRAGQMGMTLRACVKPRPIDVGASREITSPKPS